MTQYTLKQASQLLQSKQISAVELATEYLAAIADPIPSAMNIRTLISLVLLDNCLMH